MTTPTGLDPAEAARRLQRDGPNELSPPQQRTVWHIALEVAREPMFLLLVAAGGVYLLLGDVSEALVLLGFVVFSAGITLVQERRTERALDALRELTSPRAQVWRGGELLRVAGREVVQGDLLALSEGERVPADAWLLEAHDLQADESLLTGESEPVAKQAVSTDPTDPTDPTEPASGAALPRPGAAGPADPTASAHAAHAVYAGTLLVGGQGLARVIATGPRSELGRIGLSLAEITPPPTPLRLQTQRLVRVFSVMGLSLALGVVLLYGLTRGDWLAATLAGITLGMSMLPEEFMLVVTVFMAMGAWRMSRQRVLARRAATIETLGAATVLCSDKTGTLTMNRMAVAELLAWPAQPGAPPVAWTAGAAGGAMPPAVQALAESGLLASEPEPVDPMDRALHETAREHLPAAGAHPGWQLVHEHGLAPELLAMTHIWQPPGGGATVLAAKGAVEAITLLCRLPPDAARALAAAADAMAGRGLRVLAVARAAGAAAPWPDTPHGYGWTLLGLVALADPLRPGVPEAVALCRSAGIRVLMITGDHPSTATAIARQAGLDTQAAPLTGREIATLDDAALGLRVAQDSVCARVLPEQKLRIVQALKAQGAVVAMTGDGVNDAPALKAAHIGIAMGGRGTDVAREAASLVLLDDDFGALVQAVRLGRRIHDNLRKAMSFVLSVHVPIAGLSVLPLLLGGPMVFTPLHIAFLELLIDPVCSIAFEAEAEEEGTMQRPPRDPAAPLFSVQLIGFSLLQGAVVLAAVAGFHFVLQAQGVAEDVVRAATFAALVCGNVALILASRTGAGRFAAAMRRPNPVLWRMLAAALALLALLLWVPPLSALFRFAPVPLPLLAVAAGLALPTLAVLLLIQRLQGAVAARSAAGTVGPRD